MNGNAEKPFWETRSLEEMTRAEWESLCDGCGRCCLNKLEDPDDGTLCYTAAACRLLDLENARCRDYPNRQREVPDCIRLTPGSAESMGWLPESCAYRRIAEGRPLPSWHPLISGEPASVHEAGVSVISFAFCETAIDDADLEQHILEWLK